MTIKRFAGFLSLLFSILQCVATANLVANWQSATYFYQNNAFHYYYFDLQTQGGTLPAGTYTFTCQIQTQAANQCRAQLLAIPNQQNAIQQCLNTPYQAAHFCLLFSPCQNNISCNTTYYQSSNCQTLTFQNTFSRAWFSAGRFYYLLPKPTSSQLNAAAPAILCTYALAK